ncbi:MAG: YaeQ family protein, partial [Deefgea sp.]
GIKNQLTRFEHLNVVSIPADTLTELTKMTARTMQIQCTIQDGQMWMSDSEHNILVELTTLQSSAV